MKEGGNMRRFWIWTLVGIVLLSLWKWGFVLVAKGCLFGLIIGSIFLSPFCLHLLIDRWEDWSIYSEWPKTYFERNPWYVWMGLSIPLSITIILLYGNIRKALPIQSFNQNAEMIITTVIYCLPSLMVLILLVYVWGGKALSFGLAKINIPLGPGWRYTNSTIYQEAVDRRLTAGNYAFKILTDIYINSDAFNYALPKALPLLSVKQAQQIINRLETDIMLERPNSRYFFNRFVNSFMESGRIEGQVVDFYRENSLSSEADLIQNAIIDRCFDPSILSQIYELRLFKNSQTRIKVLDKLFRMGASDILVRLAVNTPRDHSASYIINLLKGDDRLIEVALNALDQENRNCALMALSDEQKQRYQFEKGRRP